MRSPSGLASANGLRRIDSWPGDGLDCRLTVSIGVATLPDVASTAEALLQAADSAVYQAKDAGMNGVKAATV